MREGMEFGARHVVELLCVGCRLQGLGFRVLGVGLRVWFWVNFYVM